LEGDFLLHGHTGFVWAIRKDIINKVGFYDACLSGGADHLMAHAFCGDWHSLCLRRMFLDNKAFFNHYEAWAKTIFEKIKGNVTFTKGVIFHLWHGDQKDRRYLENIQHLSSCEFDPTKDIYLNESGCWELTKERKDVLEWSTEYFMQRNEDGKHN